MAAVEMFQRAKRRIQVVKNQAVFWGKKCFIKNVNKSYVIVDIRNFNCEEERKIVSFRYKFGIFYDQFSNFIHQIE